MHYSNESGSASTHNYFAKAAKELGFEILNPTSTIPHIDCQRCDIREIMLTTDHELITSKRITSMIALPIKHTSDHYNVLSVGRVELI